MPAMRGDVLELRVSLRYIQPEIWRGLRVPAHATLGELHAVLQVAFGWHDSHLHDFIVGELRAGMAHVDDEMFVLDEHAVPLGAIARAGSQFVYRYDFGDDWAHDIVITKLGHELDAGIRCTGGARACLRTAAVRPATSTCSKCSPTPTTRSTRT